MEPTSLGLASDVDEVILEVVAVGVANRAESQRFDGVADASGLIARAIDSRLRPPMDMVGRLGGEEFGLLLYDVTPKKAQERLERVAQAIAELRIEHAASPTAQFITVSMGAVGFDGQETAADLYRRADAALYAGKASGRNRVELGEGSERLAG